METQMEKKLIGAFCNFIANGRVKDTDIAISYAHYRRVPGKCSV